MRRSFLGAVGALALAGCGVANRVRGKRPFVEALGLIQALPTDGEAQLPESGATVTAAVGAPVLSYFKGKQSVALDIGAPYLAKGRWDNKSDYEIEVPAGRLIRTAIEAKGAGPEHFGFKSKPFVRWMYEGASEGEHEVRANIVRLADGSFWIFWTYPGEEFDFQIVAAPGLGAVRKLTEVEQSPNNFRRELVYTGRSGGTLSLLYREFKDDMARPAFSQALQYDISSDPVIGYQGARFRVISADNTGITYEVLASLAPR